MNQQKYDILIGLATVYIIILPLLLNVIIVMENEKLVDFSSHLKTSILKRKSSGKEDIVISTILSQYYTVRVIPVASNF
jgi:hypothetical protein